MTLDMNCPVCSNKPLDYRTNVLELPYFGETLQVTISCGKCDYRYTDIMITQQKEPMRYEMIVDSPDDMSVRVVRSTSGTVRIPELGILIEPGPMSESFVSNVEGVLERVKKVLVQLERDAAGEEELGAIRDMLSRIDAVKEGCEKVTLSIDDPFGNSAVISDKASKRTLSEEEVSRLKTGMFVIDLHVGGA
ncbi:MAG: hypothetical protein CVT48_01640 [Thermoplasmata archaeon HGW-Thermoplasmata-1]|nr:MAG: hypothetical protein CVT48_01640 [Thermoplasmata archaeon HGW-Thermoplasmata-1]